MEVSPNDDAVVRARKERLQKRANLITNILRKFMIEWNSAYMKELEAARAAAAAKAARKGRKKGRKPKPQPTPTSIKDAKKKKPKTRMQEVWAWLFTALDELLTKAKRITLEDLYRGTQQLAQPELVQFRNILFTANKKVLPPNMNINQLNLKQALWSAAAAHEYSAVDRALLAPVPALAIMRDKGLSAKQLQDLGYREGELLRVGFNVDEVVQVAPHEPARLRAAGLSVADVVAGFGGPQRLPPDLQGFRGVQKLKAAGYSAADLVAGGLDNVWDLGRAGFTASEVYSAGVPAEALRPAGFGLPELRPPGFLAPSLCVLQESDPRLLPPALEGSRGGVWPRIAQMQATAALKEAQGRHANSGPHRFAMMAGVNRARAAATWAAAGGPITASPSSTLSGYVAASARPDSHRESHRTVAWPEPGQPPSVPGSMHGYVHAPRVLSSQGLASATGMAAAPGAGSALAPVLSQVASAGGSAPSG